MTEQWLSVVDWEGLYEVSDRGRVRSVERIVPQGNHTRTAPSRVLGPGRRGKGKVPFVILSNGPRRQSRSVHLLVLEAFIGPCPPGLEACHWDGDATNNHLDNLRWDTRAANTADMMRHGRHHQANKTHCKHGHEYTPENTKLVNGGRSCRECHRIDGRKRYHENLEEQRAYRREQQRRSRTNRKSQ
jgi:hypothetical protein